MIGAELIAQARRRRSLPSAPARRLLRERAGLTQREVARLLGITRAAVSQYEAGKRTPRGELLFRYIALLEALARLEMEKPASAINAGGQEVVQRFDDDAQQITPRP